MGGVVGLGLCTFALTWQAALYESTVDIDDENDLSSRVERSEISQETYEILSELMQRPIDLRTAPVNELYALPAISLEQAKTIVSFQKSATTEVTVETLTQEGILSAEQARSLAPWVARSPRSPRALSGTVRIVSQYAADDHVVPPVAVQGRFAAFSHLRGGFLVATTRRTVSTPTFDSSHQSLVTDGFQFQAVVPRVYVEWKNEQFSIIAGTFTVGFAEKLTLDVTRRARPYGLYFADDFQSPSMLARACPFSSSQRFAQCGTEDSVRHVTRDFEFRDVFRGVAASVDRLPLGTQATVSLYGFGSFQSRSVWQYEIFDRRNCDDPGDDRNFNCQAPTVLDDRSGSKFSGVSLPNLYDEVTAGGHVTFAPLSSLEFGLTGYASRPIFKAQPMELDFQEWSRRPRGGLFGAVGLNAEWRTKGSTHAIEGTRSFDLHTTGGGGFGAVVRSTFDIWGNKTQLLLRYFDADFTNPFGRPPSAPDEYEGQAARNEAGAQIRSTLRVNQHVALSARGDVWTAPRSQDVETAGGSVRAWAQGQVDGTVGASIHPSLWIDLRNRGLGSGAQYRVTSRVQFGAPRQPISMAAQGSVTIVGETAANDLRLSGFSTFAELKLRPMETVALRCRGRYAETKESVSSNNDAHAAAAIIVDWQPIDWINISTRYDMRYSFNAEKLSQQLSAIDHRFVLDMTAQF